MNRIRRNDSEILPAPLVIAEFQAMRQHLIWVVVGLAFAVWIPGCGPNVSKSDMGTIVYEVPTVAGVEEPYQVPKPPSSSHETKPASKTPSDKATPP